MIDYVILWMILVLVFLTVGFSDELAMLLAIITVAFFVWGDILIRLEKIEEKLDHMKKCLNGGNRR